MGGGGNRGGVYEGVVVVVYEERVLLINPLAGKKGNSYFLPWNFCKNLQSNGINLKDIEDNR